MAERRMFTKKITDDDNFMALSSSAQALYLHLSMSSDDDGFSNQVAISMFKAHASVQDLEALLEKRYIYQFDNGVIVIKHWRMANALRKDRYTPTVFQEELAKLDVKDNGSYTWLPNGCQMVATDKERIEEDRKDKDSKEKKKSAKRIYYPEDEKLNNAFVRFIEHRKKMKKPLDEYKAEGQIKKLDKLSGGDPDLAIAIIQQSIDERWVGLFELKANKQKASPNYVDNSGAIDWSKV